VSHLQIKKLECTCLQHELPAEVVVVTSRKEHTKRTSQLTVNTACHFTNNNLLKLLNKKTYAKSENHVKVKHVTGWKMQRF
jgi:hypothetical protein